MQPQRRKLHLTRLMRIMPLSLLMGGLLLMPLQACAIPDVLALLGDRSTVTVVSCPPQLPKPPKAALDALVGTAATDPATGRWLIDLSKHRDQISACQQAAK